ncbi:MAG: hypothetical protein LBS21_10125 [Clostridiales bacterium]|jgi:hypothetical protein|nr:hypothetical protein [Clostridiales bacterium]
MQRCKVKIAIMLVVGILITVFIIFLCFPVIYPTKSSSNKLSIVEYGGYYLYSEKPIITLKHYIDETHVADYVLTIENGIRDLEPQFYDFPELFEGAIEVNLELHGREKLNFQIDYNQAKEIYEKGLLIYFDSDFNSDYAIDEKNYLEYDRYIHFISGKNKICFFKKAGYSQWSVSNSSPRLKKIPRNVEPYSLWYSGWKENNWIKAQGNNSK